MGDCAIFLVAIWRRARTRPSTLRAFLEAFSPVAESFCDRPRWRDDDDADVDVGVVGVSGEEAREGRSDSQRCPYGKGELGLGGNEGPRMFVEIRSVDRSGQLRELLDDFCASRFPVVGDGGAAVGQDFFLFFFSRRGEGLAINSNFVTESRRAWARRWRGATRTPWPVSRSMNPACLSTALLGIYCQ